MSSVIPNAKDAPFLLAQSLRWRALIQERVVPGLAAAKRRGPVRGPHLAIIGEKLEAIPAALNDGKFKAAVYRNFGVKRTTLIETLIRRGRFGVTDSGA
jgi:hypothetical protein